MLRSTKFPTESLTRRDVVRRQLSTSITLILSNGDAVSAEVLAWASVEILRGVAKALGIETFQATLEDYIKPEHLGDWRKILKNHYNYFKHADKDPERVVTDFRPDATTWAVFGACVDYTKIYGMKTWPILVYQIWFLCRHPEIAMGDGKFMTEKISPVLENPADCTLRESTAAAFEVLKHGREDPALLTQFGPAWLSNLEPE